MDIIFISWVRNVFQTISKNRYNNESFHFNAQYKIVKVNLKDWGQTSLQMKKFKWFVNKVIKRVYIVIIWSSKMINTLVNKIYLNAWIQLVKRLSIRKIKIQSIAKLAINLGVSNVKLKCTMDKHVSNIDQLRLTDHHKI